MIEKLEKLLANPQARLHELERFILDLIPNLKGPTSFARQHLEYDVSCAKDEIVRAKSAFFGSIQKSENATWKLEWREKRLTRFHELESGVPIWRTVLDSFVGKCNEVRTLEKTVASTKKRHETKIQFEQAHGLAYAKAAALDAKTRQRASRSKNELRVTENCPYCNGPLGRNPHADHIYPVKRGGLSTMENMVYCCQACNSLKGDRGLVEFLMAENLDFTVVCETLRSMGKRI